MTKKLAIVESPNKVKTVKKYLGSGWEVTASVGHTYKLPKKDYVDVKNDFKLNYIPDPDKKGVLSKIIDLAKDCDEIYFFQDQDVEGACIARHLYEHIYKKYKNKKTYTRVNLKEITQSGVQKALKGQYPMTDVKEDCIVQAGFLRRIEDRFVGFKISPIANIYVQEKTSAGRVQSPALRLVVEKEKEIQAFTPVVYYDIFAQLFPFGTTDVFTAKYTKDVHDEATSNLIVSQVKKGPISIENIVTKQTKSSPPSPFITKTLLASASTILNWKTKKTTQIAQSLFTSGHITYPRCDNPIISKDAITLLSDYTKKTFSANYIPSKIPDYNNKKAKLEHECIRPTDLDAKPTLDPDQAKLYDLIKRRFVAAGLEAAIYDSVSVDIKIGKHPFKATGSTQVFDGFTQVWNFTKKTDTTLPSLTKSTSLQLRDTYGEKKQTKPPSRFKGASLIEALDKLGIGKPSTMDSILSLLEFRQYIKYDKQSIVPTELGIRLNDFLSKYFINVIDFDFTAKVESDQDKVMLGQLTYKDAIKEFYDFLKKEIKDASIKIGADKKENEETSIICPKCNENPLMKKLNRRDNKYFYSCSGYTDKTCMATFSIDENGQPVENIKKQEVLMKCPGKNCKGDLVKRINKKTGEAFYACTCWRKEDGNCKITANANGKVNTPKVLKKFGKCPKCNKGTMVERTSKSGDKFKGCNNYPKCKHTESI